ncbi:MAG TPA: tRNA (adenine-N1)-methyltransferase [Syntrophobacteraceae bacterium]|nr:tRNA (adenine-N1)-methyltransferase [Syntrophobacteraceae bacterium]
MAAFQLGDWVLLTSQKGKKWLARVEDAPYSSHLGGIRMTDVVGKEEGDCLETTKGAKLFLFRPTLQDYIYRMERQTQIIYPKDLAAIVFYGDVRPGDVILESGLGAGALCLALLRAVGGRGTVISVEKRAKFARQAMANIHKFLNCKPENHWVVVADIQDFSMTAKVDRIFLDLPEPWHAVGSLAGLLRPGGILVSLSPNVGQVQLMHRELKGNGFANVVTFELLQREWKVDELRARPVDRMIAHTGFITVARKVPVP